MGRETWDAMIPASVIQSQCLGGQLINRLMHCTVSGGSEHRTKPIPTAAFATSGQRSGATCAARNTCFGYSAGRRSGCSSP